MEVAGSHSQNASGHLISVDFQCLCVSPFLNHHKFWFHLALIPNEALYCTVLKWQTVSHAANWTVCSKCWVKKFPSVMAFRPCLCHSGLCVLYSLFILQLQNNTELLMPILTQGDCSLCPSNDFPGVVSAVPFCYSKGFPPERIIYFNWL